MTLDLKKLINPTLNIAKLAGDVILDFYQHPENITVQIKSDTTPVTEADIAAHEIIKQGLGELTPDIPVLSEEAADIPFDQRQQWSRYWLIDPLDGTKEFIHRTDDFTVNIALIENHLPIIGIVYAPIFDLYYFAARNMGAFKQTGIAPATAIHVRTLPQHEWTILTSRRHGSKQVKKFLTQFNNINVISRGSSLKSCLVAEGAGDCYPCLGPTSEWDIAAAQCVVAEAGGIIIDLQGNQMRYNVKESVLNPPLLIIGDTKHDWLHYFKN